MRGCDYLLPILPGNIVYRGQLGTANVEDAGKAIIRIVKNPKDQSLHFQNISGKDMECITPSGKILPISNGGTAPANHGLGLRFANGLVTVL